MKDPKDVNENNSQVDVGSASDVDEIMKKYDRESNIRPWTGVPALVIKALLACFSLFMIYMNLFAVWDERIRRPLFLGVVILFVFILYPAKKSGGKPQKPNRIPFYDILIAALGAGSFFYFVANNQTIINHATRINELEVCLGVIGILVLAECCRRVTGIPILVVAGCFIIYAFSTGKNLTTWEGFYKILRKVVYNLFYTTTGVIGTPVGVCSTYIVLFIIFGAFLEATGIADFFIQCANCIAGSASGGPAKVAVISSALCGMVSGSSVGNTVTTGSVTIPMMKKTGYPGEFAGAVEAAASTGGQIMPPIMGAAAFLMAEMVGVPYSNIVVRAILPAVLFFVGIFLMVHLRAKKLGLKGIPKENLPQIKKILPKIYLLIPLAALVYLIVTGYTMSRSAIYATLLCIVVSLFDKEHRMTPKKFIDALETGAKNTLS
ncbi:MAG: TRAP transporter fused permease subunit, partial [Blautia sp.]|nr:TRAP transporter fused permease subunit [Blautia sp.]